MVHSIAFITGRIGCTGFCGRQSTGWFLPFVGRPFLRIGLPLDCAENHFKFIRYGKIVSAAVCTSRYYKEGSLGFPGRN
jgi:hypothetical protein